MNVAVVGGGPGGLYSALLIKKAHPDWPVSLHEKNREGATYGWGVVFSDRTLTSFREADLPTYESIVDAFVTWDAIDVRYKDEVIRCGGQGFSGISRRKLLRILHDRCEELGVELHYSSEIAGATSLSDSNLIIAADGVHSAFRLKHAERFAPSYVNGRSRYIWFGTERPFDSFTFVFRNNDDGLFQVHAYPFDASMGTFIVECSAETWSRAGLDSATEAESIAYCEKLFAPELRGRSLQSNASRWASFVTLKNKRWRAGDVVLLGDAAHTAHFSIGSGTKLAMEDAISLARGLEQRAGLDRALSDYELDRRPRVERFQVAARQSQTYFENTHRYLHLEPRQFAFHLLTRSGRVDYNGLRLGDRRFVAAVDGWFARVSGVAPPPAFVPLALGRARLTNRLVAKAGPSYASADGRPGPECERSLAAAAATGAGLVATETLAVSAHGRITPGCPGIYEDAHSEHWKDLLKSFPNTAFAATIGHSGRRGATAARTHGIDRPLAGGWGLLAPSPVPYSKRSQVPVGMTGDHMADVIDDFVTAAKRTAAAGFAVLVVDMSHGYLLGSFLSPLSNERTDEYGVDVRGRARFPLEVLRSIRGVWPADRTLGVALSAVDWARRGTTVAESVLVARMLRDEGAELIEVRAGQTTSAGRPRYDPYHLISYSDRIRNEAHVATMATGAIMSVDDVNTILGAGRADLCVLLDR